MSKINFILPDFLAFGRNNIIIDIFKNHKEILRDNVNIYSFFGTFPRAIWNGGRVDIKDEYTSIKEMKKVRDYYNKNGIKITFTFTNALIKEQHLNDEYCNKILAIFDNGFNEVLVVSEVLENYIRKNYPKYKINKSITFADSENPYDTSKYHLSVIDKNLNRDFKHLKSIKEKEKIEILCDEVCVDNCPHTKQHYTEISEINLGNENPKGNKHYGACRYRNLIPEYKRLKHRKDNSSFYISPEDIEKIYYPMGYEYFKLSGREKFNVYGYFSIIYYLIKPEYFLDVTTYIWEHTILESSEYYLKNTKKLGEINE